MTLAVTQFLNYFLMGLFTALILLFSRWIPRFRFWTDLCRRRWLRARLLTSLLIKGRKNCLDQKVKLMQMFWQSFHCFVWACPDVALCLSAEPGALWPVAAHQHVLMQHH